MTPRQLFKVLWVVTVMGILASEVHFCNLDACRLAFNSISNSPDRKFLIFFGSPIIETIALFIKKGDTLIKSFSFHLIMIKQGTLSLEKALFSYKLEENSSTQFAQVFILVFDALEIKLEPGALFGFLRVVAIIEKIRIG